MFYTATFKEVRTWQDIGPSRREELSTPSRVLLPNPSGTNLAMYARLQFVIDRWMRSPFRLLEASSLVRLIDH